MSEEVFSITGNLQNARVDGENRKGVPRHSDIPVTSYLDVGNLIIDEVGTVNRKDCPAIKTMLSELLPQS